MCHMTSEASLSRPLRTKKIQEVASKTFQNAKTNIKMLQPHCFAADNILQPKSYCTCITEAYYTFYQFISGSQDLLCQQVSN